MHIVSFLTGYGSKTRSYFCGIAIDVRFDDNCPNAGPLTHVAPDAGCGGARVPRIDNPETPLFLCSRVRGNNCAPQIFSYNQIVISQLGAYNFAAQFISHFTQSGEGDLFSLDPLHVDSRDLLML
jgi:hypothetical protein